MTGSVDTVMSVLSSAKDLLLVVLGFSAIIVLHELGHFLAARWAKIRVLAFAVGFGPALVSFRKGLGWRRGSSEAEYRKLVADDAKHGAGAVEALPSAPRSAGVSSTEYRLNFLPFGGYVKMLGQDDADPGATSNEPDSFQNCPVWKRMIVISAGVVANIITAAVLFVIVFNPHIGLLEEPAKCGDVTDPDRPAAVARAENAAALGVTEPGLKPGDKIVSINGDTPEHFKDFALDVAMSHKEEPLRIGVQRPGVNGTLWFNIVPQEDEGAKMLSIGVSMYASDRLLNSKSKRTRDEVAKQLAVMGFPQLEPGMRLVEVAGKPSNSPYDLESAARESGGKPLVAVFEGEGGKRESVDIKPAPVMSRTGVTITVQGEKRPPIPVHHVLGLTSVLAVEAVEDKSPAAKGGVKAGDVFARVGDVEWPNVAAGIAEISSYRDKDIAVAVLRQVEPCTWKEIDLGKIHTTNS